ncbi:gamma-glutamyltransferase family protein [Halorussus halophilus]|uniref:gamma-glutamyltransferase family protein n=1 Tax=Halorussus halophilus TaxID=2650975 RepID=UPI00130195C6|nr:gamma-glutamyltransferase family protein [Halorussus halophilus]
MVGTETAVDLDRFGSRRSVVYGNDGIIATSQPLAATAGIEILREGGNAFDAAVATAATLNVVEPTSTGLGGDAFMLYRTADGDVGAMRSCGGAPADATIENVRAILAEEQECAPEDVTYPLTGPHTVTVPGTARGWETTVETFGRRSLAEVLRPAIEYAEQGYPVTEFVAQKWTHAETLFEDQNARETFLLDGRSPRVGEVIRLPDLGDSLRTIASEGADVVYEGSIADAIVDEVREKGGLLSTDDLASFEPEFVDPVSTTYGGAEIYELPPNNQGLVALEALNIAEELGVGELPAQSPRRTHYLVEALKLAFHDGHHYITDPEYEDVPPLASKQYASERAATVGEAAATNVSIGVPESNAEDADTVLLTVADGDGNVVTFINSLFKGFGSGLVAGDTGIALQNRGRSFSLDPEHPNRLEPGKRPFHTLIPALVRFGADDWAAFGVMGGFMQPQGHLQVLSNVLDCQDSLQTALDAPRWRYRESGVLSVEARMTDDLLAKLARRGHDVQVRPPEEFGGGQFARYQSGVLSGATDPRKDGTVGCY